MNTDYPRQKLAANVEAALNGDAQNGLALFDLNPEGSSNLEIWFAI